MSEQMLDLEMIEASKTVVEKSLTIQPDEEVLVIADPRTVGIGRNFAIASNATGATTTTAIMPLLESHGNEPPDTIADAMAAADVVITPTTHAITHTHARLRAAETGTRIGIIRGVTEDMMIEGAMTVDFDELRRTTEQLAAKLNDAKSARVTSDLGMDVEFSLEGSSSWPLDGFYHEEYGFASLPPGEAPTSPAEGTAQGTIVIDVTMDGVENLDEPLHWNVEDGLITHVSGGEGAARLNNILEQNDSNARNLAEFAIATNPNARFVDNPAEDKLKEGTVHFAVGDNESLGGSVRSDIHLDGVARTPTVFLDGDLVVDEGNLLVNDL